MANMNGLLWFISISWWAGNKREHTAPNRSICWCKYQYTNISWYHAPAERSQIVWPCLYLCAVSKSRGALMPAGWLSLLYFLEPLVSVSSELDRSYQNGPSPPAIIHPNPTGRQHEASLTSFKAHLRPKERCEDFCRLDAISIDNWQPWQRHQTYAGWNPEQDPGKETPSILRKLQFHTCYLGFNGCVSRLGDQLVVQQQVMSTPAMELETGIGAAERPQELEVVPEDRHCTAFKGVVKTQKHLTLSWVCSIKTVANMAIHTWMNYTVRIPLESLKLFVNSFFQDITFHMTHFPKTNSCFLPHQNKRRKPSFPNRQLAAVPIIIGYISP